MTQTANNPQAPTKAPYRCRCWPTYNRFLATSDDTKRKSIHYGRPSFLRVVGLLRTVHSREEEGFYIMEGEEITLQIGDDKNRGERPATFANMPVGMPHSFKNEEQQNQRRCSSLDRSCWA